VQAIAPLPGQPMVEIGPGLAALTQPLVERLGRLTVLNWTVTWPCACVCMGSSM